MMRRLAAQQGVKVTNGMLLKQGIPVMIPVMFVACLALIHATDDDKLASATSFSTCLRPFPTPRLWPRDAQTSTQ